MQREGERKPDGERESTKEGGRERDSMYLYVCRHAWACFYVCVCLCICAMIVIRSIFTLSCSLTGRSSLRSSSRGDFLVPFARTATKQRRAFSIVGPTTWNDLPSFLRLSPRTHSTSFYTQLKIFLYDQAWLGSASE